MLLWAESAHMESCPALSKAIFNERKSPPWMSKKIVQPIRKRNYYFRKFKATKCTIMHEKHRSLRGKVVASLHQLKCSFFMNLKPKPNRTLWKTVNTLSRSKSAVPTLIHDDVAVASDSGKPEALNAHFTSCFNYSVPPIVRGS